VHPVELRDKPRSGEIIIPRDILHHNPHYIFPEIITTHPYNPVLCDDFFGSVCIE
jgi:hypothetical protein